ncbi:hypothetical protein WJX79_006462 [Trebouxia sp. C0005]
MLEKGIWRRRSLLRRQVIFSKSFHQLHVLVMASIHAAFTSRLSLAPKAWLNKVLRMQRLARGTSCHKTS